MKCIDDACKNVAIEEAIGESTIIHAPYTENGNVVKLITKWVGFIWKIDKTSQKSTRMTIGILTTIELCIWRQHIRIIDIIDTITDKIEIGQSTEIDYDLVMNFRRDPMFDRIIDMKARDQFINDWEFAMSPKIAIEIMKKIIAIDIDDKNLIGIFKRNDPAGDFGHAIDIIYTLNYAETEEIFNEIVKAGPPEEAIKRQRIFVEIVSAAGHNAGIQFIIDKIQSGEIQPIFIKNFLSAIHKGIADHSEAPMEAILNFCQSEIMTQLPSERMQCMLVYTAIIDEACRISSYSRMHIDRICVNQKLQEKTFIKVG